MTDERDPKLSRRYRELGSEQPSRELDQTILAAAHRAADRPHAPLVTPAGRHRWYFAFGAAAVLVLAVAVTVQVERQQPDPEALPALPDPVRTDRAEDFPPAREARRAPAREAPPAASAPTEVKPPPSVEAQSQTGPAPSAKPDSADSFGLRQRDLGEANRVEVAPKPAPAPSAQPERREQSAAAEAPASRARTAPEADMRVRGAAEVQRAPAAKPVPSPEVLASAAAVSPERLLERIAELRKEGRHDEADKALAEFRQRYPDYRISEEMLQKIERKK